MSERRTQGDDLTGRRGGYKELKSELYYFFRQIWVIVIAIGVVCTIGLGGFGYLLLKQQQEALERCHNQNIRHDNAITALIVGSNKDIQNADKLGLSPDEIRRRRDVTIDLIDAIAPKTDCNNPVKVKPLPTVTPIPEETP